MTKTKGFLIGGGILLLLFIAWVFIDSGKAPATIVPPVVPPAPTPSENLNPQKKPGVYAKYDGVQIWADANFNSYIPASKDNFLGTNAGSDPSGKFWKLSNGKYVAMVSAYTVQ